jgi:hypothetical protein
MKDYERWSLMTTANVGSIPDIMKRKENRIKRKHILDYIVKLLNKNKKYHTYKVIKKELIEKFTQQEFENCKGIITRYLKNYTFG